MSDHQPQNDVEPRSDYDEPFHGFEMTDEQIPEGPFRPVAIELKHVFEELRTHADVAGHALFLPQHVQDALSEFFWRPCLPTLTRLLEVSPTLHESISDITQRAAPALRRQIPDAT